MTGAWEDIPHGVLADGVRIDSAPTSENPCRAAAHLGIAGRISWCDLATDHEGPHYETRTCRAWWNPDQERKTA